ncbi:hypothetical protein [Prosthecobacter vanneervenii]|uniref:Uncharacterized protein n=1 Tax=Prosthecobacter vanneervenii TaxID=48466 RepID=A0A7W7YGD1_9BACT|nr:hypothetical protein [Prosthecobacter vanneervenii]MBB5035708.1 hypothetical protein [Prosthecobacter vanneervenii]
MTDALGVDSDIVILLRCAALDKKPVSHLLALLRLTHDPAGENSFSYFTVLHYFEEAFDWNIRQIGALKMSCYFADKPWPDEALNARYAPQLEAWRKNPSTYPRPERDAALSQDSAPLSGAECQEAVECLEMDRAQDQESETSRTDFRTYKMNAAVVFPLGAVLALALGGFLMWAGARDNNQGGSFHTVTGQWDWWRVVPHFIWPLLLWVLMFALSGGLRQQVKR